MSIDPTLGPLHTQDWEHVTITLQALSLVEKADPVQARFTLRLRDQWSMWMQDGCNVYVDSYMALNGSCFMVTWIILKNHLLEVGVTQYRESMALRTLTAVDLFYFIMREDPHEQNILEGPGTYDFTLHLRIRDHTTWFWRCLGTASWHFLLGSHNVMVTALDSCVKWPLAQRSWVSKWANDRGEPTVSYKWTSWVWKITGWSSKLQENYRSF